jgi:hypothetical protein
LERSGLIDLSKTKARNYEAYYLKRNPFPAIGIPEETLLITADRETVIRRFQNVIREVLDTGRSIITVMVGEYGSGKSHLLKLFKKSVDTQLLYSEGTMAVYVKSPGEDFSYFLFGFIDNIGFELLTELSKRYLVSRLVSDASLLKHIFNEKIREAFVKKEIRLEDAMNKTRILDLFGQLKKTDFAGIDADLSHVFLSLCDPRIQQIAWRWLIGETLDKEERDLLNVDSSAVDQKRAYKTYLDLVKILKKAGIKNLVILVDELEKITLLGKLKEAKYQDDLRKLIDDHPESMCFYFAIAPKQWQDLTREPTALVRRLKGNWHLLEDFGDKETRELVEKYLFSVRIDLYTGEKVLSSFPEIEPSLYPFTKEALAVIRKETKGVVSDILLVCRKALELLCDSKEEDLVTKEIAERALTEKE